MKIIKKLWIKLLVFIQTLWLKRQIKKGREFKIIVCKTLKRVFVGLGDERKANILKKAMGVMDSFNYILLIGINNRLAQDLNIITGEIDIQTREDSEGWPTNADITVTVTIDYKKLLKYRKE